MLLRNVHFGFLKRRLLTLLQDGAGNPAKKVFIEVYGCQMNTNDAEIVHGILRKSPEDSFVKVDSADEANVVLLMTCAIRENAESKIWGRLGQLKAQKKQMKGELTVGVLGCMAERLKHKLLEADRSVDLVCGPDSYRDLPLLLRAFGDHSREQNMSVALSADETYGDIAPVRLDSNQKTAYVSIMRGCNNMCAFCIVPFTR
jgi:tRNA-2-methylthio-N6-dimethylallyladenosine synthase